MSGLSPGDSARIRTIAESDWTTAFIARDLDRVCGMCDPDIVYMPADHPALLGTSALREFLAAFPPVTSFTQPLEMIEGSGTWRWPAPGSPCRSTSTGSASTAPARH